MKYLLLSIVVLGMVGCNNGERTSTTTQKYEVMGKRMDVVIIDNCEYLVISNKVGDFAIAHKGNCRNHSHNHYIK